MIIFWYSLLSAICFVLIASNADFIEEYICPSPMNYDFSPSFHKHSANRLSLASYKQLLKYVSSNISGYTELADFLSGPSANLDSILSDLSEDLIVTRKLVIRPADVAESVNKSESSYSDEVRESDFENIGSEIKSLIPTRLYRTRKVDPRVFSTSDQLILVHDVKFSTKVKARRLPPSYLQPLHFAYNSEWIPNCIDGVECYKLQVSDSSPVDIYVIAALFMSSYRERLLKFDYSTLAGIPNITVALDGTLFEDVYSISISDESKKIHFIEKTSIDLIKDIDGRIYNLSDHIDWQNGNHRTDGATLFHSQLDFPCPPEMFIAVVHRAENTLVGLGYTGFTFFTTYFYRPVQWVTMVLHPTPISDMLPNFTGNSFVMSPLAHYHQVIYKYKYVDRVYLLEDLKTVRRFFKQLVGSITSSKKIQLKNWIYVDKDFDMQRGIRVIDFSNKSVVKEINRPVSRLFPRQANLSDAYFMMNSRIDINLQLNNQKYQSHKVTEGGPEIPLMFVKSDTFYHCLTEEPGKGMFIYRLPLVDKLPVHLYIIEVKKDSNVRIISNIDYTNLISRNLISQKDIWIPEVYSEQKLHQISIPIVSPRETYEKMKFHHLQNTSIALTANNMSHIIYPTNPGTNEVSIINFIYAVVHKDSGIVIATGFHGVTLPDIVRPFAVDFDTKAIISFDNEGKNYATSILGHFLNNFLLKHVKRDHAVKLKALLHGQDFNLFNAMHQEQLKRYNTLINLSIKNKLFIGVSDASEENHETNEGEVKLIDFANPKTVVESINEFSAGIIKEEELTSFDRLVMVSDVQIKLTLMINGHFRSIPEYQSMVSLYAKRYSSSRSDCLVGAKYYQLPLEESVKREIDLFVIVPDGGDRLDTSCIHKIDFKGLKFETYEDLLVPRVNIVKKFHKNLKDIMDNSTSSDDQNIHILQKVSVQWDGREMAIDPSLIVTTYIYQEIVQKFLWAVVANKDLILAHGFVD